MDLWLKGFSLGGGHNSQVVSADVGCLPVFEPTPTFSVLPRCKGLVAVWLLLLRPSGVLRRLLRPDDVRDAATPEGKSEDLPE